MLPYLSLTSFTEFMACLSQVFTVSCVGVLQLKDIAVQSMSKSLPRLTYVAVGDGLLTFLADNVTIKPRSL